MPSLAEQGFKRLVPCARTIWHQWRLCWNGAPWIQMWQAFFCHLFQLYSPFFLKRAIFCCISVPFAFCLKDRIGKVLQPVSLYLPCRTVISLYILLYIFTIVKSPVAIPWLEIPFFMWMVRPELSNILYNLITLLYVFTYINKC